ncbi:MAG TPA: adenylate/guanylate cyclase domain-containing protein, partial [Candidatus Limnocylindrales bacterium]|nr:adenylate/guanylate cyclase domain-containing protein [Candidatus Limnocylindrales bacterium]
MRTCPSCGELNSERARFCQACGTSLPESIEPTAEVRKVVTIVFADMAGSTQIGETLDPEALRRVQARYFETLTAAIGAHGGSVEKYIGDAVMAVFGIPRLHEDDALRAVRAAADMQAKIAALGDELERDHGVRIEIRIGVNTGEVVAGDPTTGQRLVTGDAVNVASRLEQAAGAGEILIAAATYWLVKDAVEVDEATNLDVRGRSAAVAAYRLLGVRADTAGHVRHLDSPMVGRSRELDLVVKALGRVRDERTSFLFTLLGMAGVGKSRLVREFLAGVEDATVLSGRCLSYGEGITFYAIGEIIREAASIAESDDAPTARAKLSAVLAGAPEAERIARLVGGILGWAEPTAAEDASWSVRKLLEHIARERPVVVVIDDVHWAEPLLLDLIEHLADWTRDAAVVILCVARPELLELRPGWGGGKMNATSILLEPLAADDAGTLLANLLGDSELPTAARTRILAAAEGNPLFVEEMIGMLIDDGLLRHDGVAWRAASDLADLTVPPTIQLLLAARLDRLEAEERAVIERGAVEGKVFHSGAIAALSSEGLRPQVRPRLLALARKELIRPDRPEFAGEDAFRFRHMLIRDAAYQAMPKEQRAELHEGFARWLTGVAGERVIEYEEILAYHLEQAYGYHLELGPIDEHGRELGRAAGRALRASAERAQARGDFSGSNHMLERAASVLDGTERLAALTDLGENLAWADENDRAAAVLREVVRSPLADDDPAIRIRASLFLVFAQVMNDPTAILADTRARCAELLAEAEALGDEEATTACLLGLGQMAFWLGDLAEHLRIVERLTPRVARLRTIYRQMVAGGYQAAVYFGDVPVDEGFEMIGTIRVIIGDGLEGTLQCELLTASLYSMADRPADFDAAIERWERIWVDAGSPPEVVGMGQRRAESLFRLGRADDAIAHMRSVKTRLDSLGETGLNSTTTALIAYFLADTGRVDEAQAPLDEARALAASDDFGSLVPIDWTAALIASARGEHATALAAADDAERLIRGTEYLNWT